MGGKTKICLYGPYPPPYGGLATQTLSLYKQLTKEGIIVSKINYIHKIYEIPIYLYNAIRYSIKSSVVHVICGSYKSFFRASLIIIVAKIFGKKVILMSEGETENFLLKHYLFVSSILKLTDIIIVYSKYLGKVFNKYGFEVKIIPDFISYKFDYRLRKNVTPTILMAKNISSEYNYLTAIKSFQIIKNLYPNAKLIIAGEGEGDYFISLKRFIKDNKINDITFLGSVVYEKMPELYSKADIFLNTTNVDNFPRCILESFSAGTITVSTNVGGIPYMIKDCYNGFLVKPNCHEETAMKIIYILKHPKLAEKVSYQARMDFENKYTWDRLKDQYISLYNSE